MLRDNWMDRMDKYYWDVLAAAGAAGLVVGHKTLDGRQASIRFDDADGGWLVLRMEQKWSRDSWSRPENGVSVVLTVPGMRQINFRETEKGLNVGGIIKRVVELLPVVGETLTQEWEEREQRERLIGERDELEAGFGLQGLGSVPRGEPVMVPVEFSVPLEDYGAFLRALSDAGLSEKIEWKRKGR